MIRQKRKQALAGVVWLVSLSCFGADDPRTFFVTRSMSHEMLFPFLEEARPDIVQIGQYGAMFHGYADDEKSKGTPMNLPFAGERKILAFQKDLNRKIHDLGLQSVGHFRLVKAYGNWEEKSGFVDYYENRWPKDILGPRPHPDLRELLQRDAEGNPIQVSRYNQGQIAFCLSSPHSREMFKKMLKVAVDHGVDGVITTYNYHLRCSCPHCENSFRNWLSENTSTEEQTQMGLSDLQTHRFTDIPARISGCPDPSEASQLDWLAMRWAAQSFKHNYDDIFLTYGRSLKDDLIVAQWNHLSHVSNGEERMFLPIDSWGKGEDYFWESGGASFVGKNLNLAEHKAGDAWLSCLVIRELGDGKPFMMGKYDGMRLAVSMAEGFATGGLGMGRYMRFEDPVGFTILSRYTRFRNQKDELFADARSLATIALVLPRQSLWDGNLDAMADFRKIGQELLEQQILFDVIADENLKGKRLSRYDTVIVPESCSLSGEQKLALEAFQSYGNQILDRNKEEDVMTVLKQGRFQIEAPWTVRFAAYQTRTGNTVFHLVNFDRDEGATKQEKGNRPVNERPRAVHGITVKWETDTPPDSIRIHQPELTEPSPVEFKVEPGWVTFTLPDILVYGVIEIR